MKPNALVYISDAFGFERYGAVALKLTGDVRGWLEKHLGKPAPNAAIDLRLNGGGNGSVQVIVEPITMQERLRAKKKRMRKLLKEKQENPKREIKIQLTGLQHYFVYHSTVRKKRRTDSPFARDSITLATKIKLGIPGVCYYCGAPAQCTDHVIPYSMLTVRARYNKGAKGGITVACCTDCNAALGSRFFGKMEYRCHFIKEYLTQRWHRKPKTSFMLKRLLWQDSAAFREMQKRDARKYANQESKDYHPAVARFLLTDPYV